MAPLHICLLFAALVLASLLNEDTVLFGGSSARHAASPSLVLHLRTRWFFCCGTRNDAVTAGKEEKKVMEVEDVGGDVHHHLPDRAKE